MSIFEDDEKCHIFLEILWSRSITGLAILSQEGKFIKANHAFCTLTEYTEWELQHRKFQDITDPADIEADWETAKKVASGEIEGYDMTKAYITKTKKYLPVLLRVTAMKINGEFIYFVAEVAPLDKSPSVLPLNPQVKKRVWSVQFIKDYWVQILALGGICLAVLDKILTHLMK